MPRRPNKTDYGMLDAPADIEAFYRTQMNEEVDKFLEKSIKRENELNPVQKAAITALSLSGIDFQRIYEMGWNDGHSNGVKQGKEQIWFHQKREANNGKASGNDNQRTGSEEG